MSKEITVKEAVNLTGKTDKTIRNFLKKHPEAYRTEGEGKNAKILINESDLVNHFGKVLEESSGNISKNELIEVLKNQIAQLENENAELKDDKKFFKDQLKSLQGDNKTLMIAIIKPLIEGYNREKKLEILKQLPIDIDFEDLEGDK